MDSDWSASAKRYPGGKILVASLPGVDIGSTIEVEFEIEMKNMPFLAGTEPFQLPDDLQQKTFEITAPAGLKVQRLVTGGPIVATTPAGENGKQTFRWSAEKIGAQAAEADLPPDWVYKPGVTYFVGDFNDYLTKLDDTLEDRSRASRAIQTLAARLGGKSGTGWMP